VTDLTPIENEFVEAVQQSDPRERVDALVALIENPRALPEIKVEALHEVLSAAERILMLFEPEEITQVYHQLRSALKSAGDISPQDVEGVLRRAEEIAGQIPTVEHRAEALIDIAESAPQGERKLDLTQSAAATTSRIPDPTGLASLARVAQLLAEQGLFEEAYTTAERARATARTAGDAQLRARILGLMNRIRAAQAQTTTKEPSETREGDETGKEEVEEEDEE
jgi:hypothetical protein